MTVQKLNFYIIYIIVKQSFLPHADFNLLYDIIPQVTLSKQDKEDVAKTRGETSPSGIIWSHLHGM